MAEYPPPNNNYGTVFNPIDWPGKEGLNNIEVVNRINNGIVYYETDGRIYTKDKFVFDNYKIGLNTNAPNAMIDIKNINNNDYLRLLNPSNEYKFYIDSNGNTSINSNNSNGYNLYVSGTAYIKDLDTDNIIINNTSIGSNLYVDGNTILKGTLNVTGNTLLNGNLDVSNVTTLNNNVFLKGLVGSNSLLFLSNSTKQILTDNNLTYNASANLLTCTGDGNFIHDLTVSGTTRLIDTNINNNLFVSGLTTLQNNLLVTGNTEIKNTLSVSGSTNLIDANINNNLFVSGLTTLRGSVLVTGNSDLRGTLNVSNNTTLRNTNIIGNLGINQSNALSSLQFSNENVYHLRFEGTVAAPRYYKLTSMNYGGQPVGCFRIYGTIGGDQSNGRGASIVDIRFSNRTSASGDAPTLVGSVLGNVGSSANILIYKNTVSSVYEIYLYITSYCLVDINLQRIGVNAPLSYDGSFITTAPTTTNIYSMATRYGDTSLNDSILYTSSAKDEYTLNRTYNTAGWYLISSIPFVNAAIAGIWINGWIGGDEGIARGNANINLTFKCKNANADDPIIYGYAFGQLRSDYADIVIYKNTVSSVYDVYLYQGFYSNQYITFSKFVVASNSILISSVPNYTTTPPGTLAYRLSDNFSTISNNVFYQGARTGFGIGTATPSASLHVSGNAILSNAVTLGSTLNVNGSSVLLNNITVGTGIYAADTDILTINSARAWTFYQSGVNDANSKVGFRPLFDGKTFQITTQDKSKILVDFNTTNSLTNTVRFLNSSVGIGVSPTSSSVLHVSGSTLLNGLTNIRQASESLRIEGTAVSGAGSNCYMGFYPNTVASGSKALLGFTVADNNNLSLYNQTPNGSLTLGTNGTFRVTIDNTGEVGIGGITPSAMLHVSGNAIITSNITLGSSLYVSGGTTLMSTLDIDNDNLINYSLITPNFKYGIVDLPNTTFYSITWSDTLKIWVVVGSAVTLTALDGICWSYDAITWNKASIVPNNNEWMSVIWANDRFIACSQTNATATNRMIYSFDGLDWFNTITLSVLNPWQELCYAPEINTVVCVGIYNGTTTNNIIYSTDRGVTWAVSTGYVANVNFQSVAWSPTLRLFVAVASTYPAVANSIYRSSDGITWTTSTLTTAYQWKSICWAGYPINRFVIIANSGTGNQRSLYSSNGTTWTTSTSTNTIPNNDWSSIVYNTYNYNIIAISSDGTNRIMTSTNGNQWSINSYSTTNALSSLYFNSDKTVFISINSNNYTKNVFSSTNLNDFVTNNISGLAGGANTDFVDMAFGNNRLILVCNALSGSPQRSFVSTDEGKTWSNSPMTNSYSWFDIKFANNIFVALTRGATVATDKIYTSTDGVTWAYTTTGVLNNIFTSVAYSPTLNRWVVVSSNGTTRAMYSSTPATSWTTTSVDINTSTTWRQVIWCTGLNRFIAVGDTGTTAGTLIAFSDNGISWTASSNTFSNAYVSVAYSPTLNLIIAISTANNNNRFICSTNGVNWYASILNSSSISQNLWSKIVWSDLHKKFFICNSTHDGILLYSSDGFNWYYLTIPNNKYSSIVYIDSLNKLFLLGSDNVEAYKKIAYSDDPLENIDSACVRINNTTKGLLLPSLTESQINITNNAIEGLMVYNNNTKNLSFFNGINFISPKMSLLNIYTYTDTSAYSVNMTTTGNNYATNGFPTEILLNIKPKSIYSTFLIMVNLTLGSGNVHQGAWVGLSTNHGLSYSRIGIGVPEASRNGVSGRSYTSTDNNANATLAFQLSHSPKTTNNCLFRVFIVGNASADIFINRSGNDDNTGEVRGTRSQCTITAFEYQ